VKNVFFKVKSRLTTVFQGGQKVRTGFFYITEMRISMNSSVQSYFDFAIYLHFVMQ